MDETLTPVGEFFVGVKEGKPLLREVSDPEGESTSVELFPDQEDALRRYHNVRRVMVYLDATPIRAPENWGARDDE